MSAIENAIKHNQKIIIHTGGQKAKSTWGSFNLEKVLKQKYPELKILRIDKTRSLFYTRNYFYIRPSQKRKTIS
jgi:hypothetical protein